MRIGYAMAVAAFLAGTPAMAQLTITNGDGDSARHQDHADQDRAAGHDHMEAAHQHAAMGDYRGAARDQDAAHNDRHAAQHEEHDADRDGNGGTTIQLGH